MGPDRARAGEELAEPAALVVLDPRRALVARERGRDEPRERERRRARGEADVEREQARERARGKAAAQKPTYSTVLQQTFAAASSTGVRASWGVSAACAGRCAVCATVKTTANTRTTPSGAPAAAAHAAPSSAAVRAAALQTSTDRRERRSASIAAYGAARPAGSMRTTSATATAPVPPCSYA